ncbi:oxidoreductase-like protein [Polyplosphaeria fusca]|uniref:Oxidoreductase-like protein n=1 Tax=Polyplosphaeria fusca TaxID=682080 RepID=A0A9P4V933_9PLEO|nr:oxidoreductase-like protein [Polyplosphaeria fusca]
MIPFGIIGTNWITHSFVAGAHATRKWSLRAVYSRTEASARDFASKYPDSASIALHTQLASLANSPDISTVYIASPNSLHYEHAKQMLQAGKHVVLEKPATCTAAQLHDLFGVAAERGVVLIEAFRHLHEANFKVLKQSLEKLGPVYGASLNYAQYSSRFDAVLRGEWPNIFTLEFGGGALVDLGVYCVAAAVDLFGAPETSAYHPVIVETGADGGGVLVLRYEGFAVSITASKIFGSGAPSEVYGRDGTLTIPTITDIESVVFRASRGERKGVVEGLGGGKEELNLKEEAEDYARIIEEKDFREVERWRKVSEGVIGVTEKCRKENGLLFPVEREQPGKGEGTTGIIGGV